MAEEYLKEDISLEESTGQILYKMFQVAARRNPYSVAIVANYLYRKELEVENIVTAIEAVRYHVGPEMLMKQLGTKTGGVISD